MPGTSPKSFQWNSGPSDLSRLCWQALTRQTAAGADGFDLVAAKARESTGDRCHGNSHRCHAGTGERETDVTGDRVAGADFPDIVTLKAELEKVGKFPRGGSALTAVVGIRATTFRWTVGWFLNPFPVFRFPRSLFLMSDNVNVLRMTKPPPPKSTFKRYEVAFWETFFPFSSRISVLTRQPHSQLAFLPSAASSVH